MEIYLIRHTIPEIEKGVCYGFSDLEVTDSYKEELNKIVEKLIQKIREYLKSKEQLEKKEKQRIVIYTSPLQRCSILAKDLKDSIEEYFQSEILESEDLKEMNFGDWELQKWNEIDQTELRKWTDNFVTRFAPNGESFEVLHERVIRFWRQEIENNLNSDERKIAFIISHGGVVRSLLSHVLQIPLQKVFSFSIDYGSISKLSVFETHTQVEFLNI